MSEGNLFQKNIDALAAVSPGEAQKIVEYAPKIQKRLYQVYSVNPDYVNLTLAKKNGDYSKVFQSSDPKSEIENWINGLDLNKAYNAVVLLGFGLGHYPKTMREHLPEKGVMAVVEPDPMIFFTALHHTDLTGLLSDRRIHLAVGQSLEATIDGIGRTLKWQRFLAVPYHIVVPPYFHELHPEFPNQFAIRWRDSLQRELMYRNARIEHSTQVVSQTVENAEAAAALPGVSRLFHHFQDIPAVLAAAGPSLNENCAMLQEYRDRMLIACVNTAYPVLRRNGIEPDLVLTMDHQERNVHSFDEFAPTARTWLVADPRIHPDIIRRFYPRVFIASWKTTTETQGQPAPVDSIPVPKKSGNAIFAWLQEHCGAKGDIFGSGSVAVAAFHLLARMGCKPVVLAGLDMAFSGEKRYADGTIFDDKNLPRDENSAHYVAATDGGYVATSETLHLYRQLLEHEIARFRLPVYNISMGAAINGSIMTRLGSVEYDMPKQIPSIAGLLQSLQQSYSPKMDGIDLQRLLERGISQLRAFSDSARRRLNEAPFDLTELETQDERKAMLQQMEEGVRSCREEHPLAFDLLNELLQESHFKFEDGTWRALMTDNEDDALEDRLRNHVMALDEFVKQSNYLITLFEEKIYQLDRKG